MRYVNMKKTKIVIKSIALVLILTFLVLFSVIFWPFVPSDEPWLENYEGPAFSMRFISDKIPVEEQMAILADLNYTVNPEISGLYDDWLRTKGWENRILERYPFWLIFTSLGLEDMDENGQAVYFSDSTYCLEHKIYSRTQSSDLDDYVKILEQINRISGGELDIRNVDAQYYLLGGRIVLSYELNGEPFKWSIRSSQFFNGNVVKVISEYSKKDEYDKNLYWLHDEQGVHIVYRTYDEIMKLYEVTGINFFGPDSNQLTIP